MPERSLGTLVVTSFAASKVEAAKAALLALTKEEESRRASAGTLSAEQLDAGAEKAQELLAARETAKRMETIRDTIAEKYEKVDDLKAHGYAPLMRFGRDTVTQRDGSGAVKYFSLFESQRDANKMARSMAGEKGMTVEQGVMSQEAVKQFQGMTPETMALLADLAGIEKTDVFQQYLKLAVANHPALKRMIARKGTAGFNEDVSRVLASFVTSNARASSGNLHLGEMSNAVAKRMRTGTSHAGDIGRNPRLRQRQRRRTFRREC